MSREAATILTQGAFLRGLREFRQEGLAWWIGGDLEKVGDLRVECDTDRLSDYLEEEEKKKAKFKKRTVLGRVFVSECKEQMRRARCKKKC